VQTIEIHPASNEEKEDLSIVMGGKLGNEVNKENQ
jgi:hypothetical protein